jgi:hypothetical protein
MSCCRLRGCPACFQCRGCHRFPGWDRRWTACCLRTGCCRPGLGGHLRRRPGRQPGWHRRWGGPIRRDALPQPDGLTPWHFPILRDDLTPWDGQNQRDGLSWKGARNCTGDRNWMCPGTNCGRQPMDGQNQLGGWNWRGGQPQTDGLTPRHCPNLRDGLNWKGARIRWAALQGQPDVLHLNRMNPSSGRGQLRAGCCPGRHRPGNRPGRRPLSWACPRRTGLRRYRQACRCHPDLSHPDLSCPGHPRRVGLRLGHLTHPGRRHHWRIPGRELPGLGLRWRGHHWHQCAWPAWAYRRGPVRRCHYRAHSRPRTTSQATVLQF